jgi:hypothetical protein
MVINDEIMAIINKFMFESTVKNQIKLQTIYRDNSKINELNKELLINMKSLLLVLLEQLNQI